MGFKRKKLEYQVQEQNKILKECAKDMKHMRAELNRICGIIYSQQPLHVQDNWVRDMINQEFFDPEDEEE